MNKFYEFINKNLAIIVLVPTLLGSIWQVIQIGRLNISYLRFFSISQAVIDGVLILSFLFIIYLIIEFMRQFHNKSNVGFSVSPFILKEIKKREFDIFSSILLYILLLVYLILAVEVFYPIFKEKFIVNTVNITFIFLIYSIGCYMILRANVINIFLYLIDSKVITYDQLEKKLVPNLTLNTDKVLALRILVFSMLLFPAISFISAPIIFIGDEMTIPFNTSNIDYAKVIIEEDLRSKYFKIKYFNDNYLFVEICKNESCNHIINSEYLPPKYAIYRTDNVFFKELEVR